MSILLITDTQLGMALKNIKFGKWTEKALNWSDALDPSEKELKNLNKFLQFTNEQKPILLYILVILLTKLINLMIFQTINHL